MKTNGTSASSALWLLAGASTLLLAFSLFFWSTSTGEPTPLSATYMYKCTRCDSQSVYSPIQAFTEETAPNNAHNFSCVLTAINRGRYRVTLETKRVLFREVTLDDVAILHEYMSDPQSVASATFYPHTNIEETRKYVEEIIQKYKEGKAAHWLVCHKESGTPMGLWGFVDHWPANDRAQIGGFLDRRFWNQGFGTEIAKAIIEYGALLQGYNRFDGVVQADNNASRRVLEKAGMSWFTTPRYYWPVKNKDKPYHILGLTKKEIASQLKQSKVLV